VQPRLLTLAPVTPMAGGQTPAASRAVDPRPAELPLWDAGPIRRQGSLDHADRRISVRCGIEARHTLRCLRWRSLDRLGDWPLQPCSSPCRPRRRHGTYRGHL